MRHLPDACPYKVRGVAKEWTGCFHEVNEMHCQLHVVPLLIGALRGAIAQDPNW